jgi:hypothetical protein
MANKKKCLPLTQILIKSLKDGQISRKDLQDEHNKNILILIFSV